MEDNKSNTISVKLNVFEDVLVERKWGSISTATWISGSHNEAAQFLKERLDQIVEKNPWIGGHVITKKDQGSYLVYPIRTPPSAPSGNAAATLSAPPLCFFKHVNPEDSPIHRHISLDDMNEKCTKANLLLSKNFDPREVFLKVSVVPCSKNPSSKFAVLVSLCHIVADGHTFYRIYKMLLCNHPIQSLTVERIVDTERQQVEALGGTECKIASSPGFVLCMLRGLFKGMCLAPFFGARYRTKWRYFLVDEDKIKALKDEALKEQHQTTASSAVDDSDNKEEGDVKFVSTNDIITSWYLRNCACVNGTMALNFRNRLEGHTEEHAGNYENLLYYQSPKDCQTPMHIRKSIQKLRGSSIPESPWEFGREDMSIMTNWASFVADVDIPGCVEEAHYPVAASSFGVTSLSMGVIFRYRPGQLAVGVFGTPAHMEGLVDAPFESSIPIA